MDGLTRRCFICGVFRAKYSTVMCPPCTISYDRSTAKDDGTLWAALKWAADRARRFERARLKKIEPPDDDFY